LKFERCGLLFLIVVSLFLSGCAKPQEALIEEAPPPQPGPFPSRTDLSARKLPPPQPAEIRSKVARIFNGAVLIDEGRAPYFIVGDFNGDLSQDLVVAVKPAPGRLPEINDELANWILVDPQAANYTQVARRQRVHVEERDALLAVIHGFGSEGWRNRKATQTYVLRNSADGPMVSQPHNQAVTPADKEKLPRISGDVILQTVSGRPGFHYFNGARYAWFDPANPPLLVHPRKVHESREDR
jgi:hypothetical protein